MLSRSTSNPVNLHSFTMFRVLILLISCSALVNGGLFLKGKKKTQQEHQTSSSCQKYILFSTQRSGSTWVSNLFDMQDGVTCGGTTVYEGVRLMELMIRYSLMGKAGRAEVEWSEYEKELSNAIQDSMDANELCNPSMQSPNKDGVDVAQSAVGFKLMYDQIPKQFVDNNQIFDYFIKNDIAIVHLIREAKILQISSMSQDYSSTMPGGEPHTNDSSVVQSFRNKTKPLSWDGDTIQEVLRKELEDAQWQISFLSHRPDIKYHKLVYENLLENEEKLGYEIEAALDSFHFEKRSELKLDSSLLQLQQPTCEGRVEKSEEFYKKIIGTKTLAACEKLDEVFAKETAENT